MESLGFYGSIVFNQIILCAMNNHLNRIRKEEKKKRWMSYQSSQNSTDDDENNDGQEGSERRMNFGWMGEEKSPAEVRTSLVAKFVYCDR